MSMQGLFCAAQSVAAGMRSFRYCEGAVTPQALSFARNHAGKPSLQWEGGLTTQQEGVPLHFNLSHTATLLGDYSSPAWHFRFVSAAPLTPSCAMLLPATTLTQCNLFEIPDRQDCWALASRVHSNSWALSLRGRACQRSLALACRVCGDSWHTGWLGCGGDQATHPQRSTLPSSPALLPQGDC